MNTNTTANTTTTPATNPNKALWEKGDFTRIADTMRESGDALVESLGITKGMKVLEVGGGDGTTALPAARRGAEVLVVDIARNLAHQHLQLRHTPHRVHHLRRCPQPRPRRPARHRRRRRAAPLHHHQQRRPHLCPAALLLLRQAHR